MLSVLLYNSETWTLNGADEGRLRAFEMSVLRRICGVSLMDRWRNEEIRALLEIDIDVVEVIRRRRLSYFGHVSRMKPERIPAKVMHGWIHGSRPRGRPRKRWLEVCRRTARDEMLLLCKLVDLPKTGRSGRIWCSGRRSALSSRKGLKSNVNCT